MSRRERMAKDAMQVIAIHPGEHLTEELKALGMTAAELARKLEVPTNRAFANCVSLRKSAPIDRVCHNECNPRPCLKPPIRL